MGKNKYDTEALEKQRILTANEFVDVKDIKGNVLYTKSGYVIGYLRLFTINISLKSIKELEMLTKNIAAQFKPEKNKFSLLVIPRTVDMDVYISFLSQAFDQEITNAIRKNLLGEMINQATNKVMSGSNFEHQIYLSVWEKYNPNAVGQDRKIMERLEEFKNRYQSIQIESKIIDDKEIIKLCNLFGNGSQALFENIENINYTPIPVIGRGM